MRILGFSVPVIVLMLGAYVLGVKYPGLFNKFRAAVSGV